MKRKKASVRSIVLFPFASPQVLQIDFVYIKYEFLFPTFNHVKMHLGT